MADEQAHDPLNFMRSMWSNMGFNLPGMVTPTVDVDELEKRIKDMKAVEGWLRMNLSMLQMTIQGLEMQHTTLTAVQRMGQMVKDGIQAAQPEAAEAPEAPPAEAASSEAAMWPWQMMQQMRDQFQQNAEAVAQEMAAESPAKKTAARRKKD